jgi:hypothetical protein
MSVFAILSALALAQSVPPGLPTTPAAQAPASSRWTVAETPSRRFPDAEVAGPTFPAGATVIVLVTDGDRVRIQKGELVGWVPASALTDQPPAPPTLPPLELPPR